MVMPTWEIRQGDVLAELRKLPSESIHTVCTSPPYWGLRDYGLPPTIWDDIPDCEHQWDGNVSAGGIRGGGDKGLETIQGGQRRGREGRRLRSDSRFCVLCGAWRGTLGLEPTPELYVRHLVEIFREIWRVLRPDGTAWLNLGDSYAGSGGAHKQHHANAGISNSFKRNGVPHLGDMGEPAHYLAPKGMKPKDVVGIPWMSAFALRGDGWWLRRPIIWHKENPMPESVDNRPTASHEDIFLLTKSGNPLFWTHRDLAGTRRRPQAVYRWVHRETGDEAEAMPDGWHFKKACPNGSQGCAVCKAWRRVNLWTGHDYFYDADSCKQKPQWPPHVPGGRLKGGVRQDDDIAERWKAKHGKLDKQRGHGRRHDGFNDRWDSLSKEEQMANGANLRDVWTIATQPYTGSHFATFPFELPRRCILLGTSEHGVCGACGAPWSRVMVSTGHINAREPAHVPDNTPTKTDSTGWGPVQIASNAWRPTCSCDAEATPSVVLDPFAGSGTTGLVALRHGRSFVGIELSPHYAEMARQRIGDDAPLLNWAAWKGEEDGEHQDGN